MVEEAGWALCFRISMGKEELDVTVQLCNVLSKHRAATYSNRQQQLSQGQQVQLADVAEYGRQRDQMSLTMDLEL